MPPQTQALIYENDKGDRVQWDGKAWSPVPKGAEAKSVAALPDANAQARAKIDELKKTMNQHQESVFVPTHGYGGGGSYVSGNAEEIEGIKSKQRVVAETGLAAAGGEIVTPLAEMGGAGRFVSALARAGGSGAGGGVGALESGADLKDAAKTAGLFGATELGLHAVFSGGEAIYKLLSDPKLSMQQASQMLAQAISKEDVSPAQFGKSIQEGFDALSRKAGQEKGEFLARISREHPDLTVQPTNLRNVLQSRVQALETMKSRNPELFKEGEAQERTLRILKAELDSANGELAGIRSGIRKGNLDAADTRRSQFWNYKQSLDPSVASRIVGELDKASTQDITEALVRQDKKLAEEYLQKSARYHELQNLGRAETLKSVFGDTRVAPGKVIEIFNQVPEDSLAALRVMNRENPVGIQNLRRQLFEQGIKTSGVRSLFKQQPALLREIYGPQTDAIAKFVDIVNTKAAGGNSLLSKVPGKMGAMMRIAEAGGRQGITIRASEMAKIIKSAEMLRLFTQAAEMPANSGPAKLMRETLERAIKAADITPGEAPAARRPLWAEERRTEMPRRQQVGQSPTGAERRKLSDIAGPDPTRTALMQNIQSEIDKLPEGNPEREVLQMRLDDMKAHPFDEPAGGRDPLREGRASAEKRMTREEAEAESDRRKAGRRQRFAEQE